MLSKRLEEVLKYINKEDIVADIGCDHGYLGIACLNKGVKFVQLIDNKEGPLSQAKHNLENYDADKYLLTLSDGLTNLNEKINTIVICGMGGELIIEIINNHFELIKKMNKIIIQPNSKQYLVREYCNNHNLNIINESILEDMDKIYEIMVLQYSENNYQKLNEYDLLFGPILRKEKNNIFIKKWENKLKENNKILSIKNDVLDIIKEKEMIEEVLYGKSKRNS